MKTITQSVREMLLFATALVLLVAVALGQNLDQRIPERNLTTEEWQQFARSQEATMFVEKGPVRVFADEGFTTNLSCRIHVGSNLYPSFMVKGTSNQINVATIDTGLLTAVPSVVRRQTTNTSFMLILYLMNENKEFSKQYDLNMDGVWDIREGPKLKHYIFFNGNWMEVDEIENRNSESPTARKGIHRFQFSKDWKPSS